MPTANLHAPQFKDAHLFVQTRARLQRITDMKFFNGWVDAISQDSARISLKGPRATIARGDQFRVEAAGTHGSVAFFGDVAEFDGRAIDLVLSHGVTSLAKNENAHYRMAGEVCSICFGGSTYTATAVDISESGLGLVMGSSVSPGVIVDFELSTATGSLSGAGKIIYCRADREAPGQFRVGIKIEGLDRIPLARWKQLTKTARA